MMCSYLHIYLTRGSSSWYTLDIFLGTLFGVGFGAFATMDWAMATDVLPHPHEFAKDMGIWSLAIVLPQVGRTGSRCTCQHRT
jgi:hypothetical protein